MKKCNGAIALLLAGGKGIRIQSKRPKQFIEMEGESILLHTMKAFERHPLVSDIYVVCNPEWDGYVRRQANVGHVVKFVRTLPSGNTSYQSFVNGIQGLQDAGIGSEDLILVHEGVRPFISHEIITNNIITCQRMGNAITAIYSHESYLQVAEKSVPQTNAIEAKPGYIPRETLMRAQTPLTFHMKGLTEIVQRAKERGIEESQSLFTLVNEIGWQPLHVVEGNWLNFKITLPQDVEVYSRLRTMNFD